MQSFNPYTRKVEISFVELTSDEITGKLKNADKAFKSWKHVSFREKAALLTKAAGILRNNKSHYASLITMEMGKAIKESLAEIEKCAWVCDYYAEHGKEFLQDTPVKSDAHESFIAYEPLGCILAVMPWNFPFWQVFRFAAPALMAGNVGILKHASNVPQCSIAIEEVFQKAGFPDDTFQSLLISSSLVEQIIASPVVKAVTITGSEDAGSKVAATAGKYLKKTVLELGGSDPFIVLNDADLDKASEFAVKSRLNNNGQTCIAAKRFIVTEETHDYFVRKLTEKIYNLKIGDPMNEMTDLGTMVHAAAIADLKEQVDRSVKHGAKVYWTHPHVPEGNFFAPCILTNVNSEIPAYHEELFGPVFSVIKAKDEDDAISIANDSNFGLGGSVWTQDIDRGKEFARKIESGAVFVNGMVKSDPRLPFGGVKHSGYGRELSVLGIREFVNQKTIWIGSKF